MKNVEHEELSQLLATTAQELALEFWDVAEKKAGTTRRNLLELLREEHKCQKNPKS